MHMPNEVSKWNEWFMNEYVKLERFTQCFHSFLRLWYSSGCDGLPSTLTLISMESSWMVDSRRGKIKLHVHSLTL